MNYIESGVHHWRFEDGKTSHNSTPMLDPLPRGWYCWVYPSNNEEFSSWMSQCCPKSEITYRFNTGNPMWTVYISDDKEAMLFRLKWL